MDFKKKKKKVKKKERKKDRFSLLNRIIKRNRRPRQFISWEVNRPDKELVKTCLNFSQDRIGDHAEKSEHQC